MGLNIAFWVLAVVAVASALAVVTLRNVFHAALSLILCFLVIAGIYVTLSADFLAVVQVLIYVGAIAVLLILAIMLTREIKQGSISNRLVIPAGLIALVFLGVVSYAFLNTPWQISAEPPTFPTTAAIAIRLFSDNGYVLPLEIAAVLLLAAVLGAIVIVREK